MLIRSATDADLPRILDIHKGADRPHDDGRTGSEAGSGDARTWLGYCRERGFAVLVALEDGRLIGHAGYRCRADDRTAIEPSIYLSEDARGGSAGAALMAALIENARGRGLLATAPVGAGNAASDAPCGPLGFARAGASAARTFNYGRWQGRIDTALALNDNFAAAGA